MHVTNSESLRERVDLSQWLRRNWNGCKTCLTEHLTTTLETVVECNGLHLSDQHSSSSEDTKPTNNFISSLIRMCFKRRYLTTIWLNNEISLAGVIFISPSKVGNRIFRNLIFVIYFSFNTEPPSNNILPSKPIIIIIRITISHSYPPYLIHRYLSFNLTYNFFFIHTVHLDHPN